jgi:hypothetical protein
VAPARRRVRSDFDLHSIAEPDPLDVEVSRTYRDDLLRPLS